MRIGKTIKRIRTIKGIKAMDFASLCNISPTTLSLIEADKTPGSKNLKVIASKLGLSLYALNVLSGSKKDFEALFTDKITANLLEPSFKKTLNKLKDVKFY